MCEVKELCKTERKLIIVMKNKKRYYSGWYEDNGVIEVAPGVFKSTESIIFNGMIEKYKIPMHLISEWFIVRKRNTEPVYISDHAMRRLKERNGWKKSTSLRMVQRIYDEGISPEDVKGYLAKWVKTKNAEMNQGDSLRLYGDILYVFHNKTLVTAYPVPKKGFNFLTQMS